MCDHNKTLTLTMTSCCFGPECLEKFITSNDGQAAFLKVFSTPLAQKSLRKVIFGDSKPVERKNENPTRV